MFLAGKSRVQLTHLESNQITVTSLTFLSCSVPPRVEAVSEVTVKEGEEVVVECAVSGNPEPTMVWSRRGSELPHGSHTSCPAASCLTVSSVARADSGLYTCSADNGVGEAASANINLVVQCKT